MSMNALVETPATLDASQNNLFRSAVYEPQRAVFQVIVTTKLSKSCLVLGVYSDEEVATQMLERLHRKHWPFYAFTLAVRRLAPAQGDCQVAAA